MAPTTVHGEPPPGVPSQYGVGFVDPAPAGRFRRSPAHPDRAPTPLTDGAGQLPGVAGALV